MKSRRYALLVALIAGAIAFAAFTEIRRSAAQQKPPDKTSPTKPKGDLITVEPATPVTATPSSEKGATPTDTPPPNTQSRKPGTEVDEKQRIIINADLITFNVTVTDIYGRFVSGLSKNAFSILDEKQPQEGP